MRARRRGCRAGGRVLLLGGCGFRGACSLSLPGGAGIGDDAYAVTVEFLDVLDLVPQSAVKVDDVTVGRVSRSSSTDDLTARSRRGQRRRRAAGQRGGGDPADVAARREVRRAGRRRPTRRRGPAARRRAIGAGPDDRNAEIEEVLGALSLVLNGGSLAQLQTINPELGVALEGREAEIKDPLDQLDTFVGGLDRRRRRSSGPSTASTGWRDRWSPSGDDRDGARRHRPGRRGAERTSATCCRHAHLARGSAVGAGHQPVGGRTPSPTCRLLQPILDQLAAAGPDLADSLELLTPTRSPSAACLNHRRGQQAASRCSPT